MNTVEDMKTTKLWAESVPVADRKRAIPGILLNTLPKSGSVYIWNALCTGLGIPEMGVRISGGWYPRKLPVDQLIASLSRGGVVCQDHLDASWQTRLLLSQQLDRMILHVRDPRSSALE